MKRFGREQGSRAFAAQCRKVELSASMLIFVSSLAYMSLTFEMGLPERFALGGCLAASVLVASLIAAALRRRQVFSIHRYLEVVVTGSLRDSAHLDTASALRSIVALPLKMQRAAFVPFLTAITLVPALMWATGYEDWFGVQRFRSLVIVSFVSSLMSGTMLFYWAKARFAELRNDVAVVAGEEGVQESAILRHSIQHKILLAVAIPTFAGMLLVVDVVGKNLRSSAEADAAQWALLAVESVSLGEASLPLAARISTELPAPEFWPTPMEFVEIRTNRSGRQTAADSAGAFLDALDDALAFGGSAGLLVPDRGPVVGAFRKLEGGGVLISKVQRSNLEDRTAALDGVVGLVSLAVFGFALVIGRAAAAEMSLGVEALQATAARMAAGDLTPGSGFGAEDEVGDATRALASVGKMLRETVERASSTAASADRTANEISVALADLVDSNAAHTEQIQQTSHVIGAIAARVEETSSYAKALSSTIDESGDSLMEIGATGDVLNETASILTSKVAAVSDSLEQMVQSVKQVAGISERLTEASEETSSSMEEMASAMRAVDTCAETTAGLSREVVSKAELGQAKVVQTIEGMEAIREATDVAEQVIRGLGARTHEIGGILDVIDDVADETSLLALNAAIIAAQAGEHGKAFSVVADEIKGLADRVLASTKEIADLIRAVQDESENAIGAIEAGSASVMSGVDLSAEAGRTLEEITIASRESGLRISEIVVSVREQTKAASQVVGLMERVRESAEEIGLAGLQQDAGNEVVYQSALAMREIAQQVRHTTEEQTLGFGRVRENVSGVREAIGKIMSSLEEQVVDCREAKKTLGRVSTESESNERVAKKIQEAVRDLVTQAASLREDAERFRV